MISRRVAMVVLGCLLAGAVVNVLVAWAFAVWGRWPGGKTIAFVDAWPREPGDGWPREPAGVAFSGWGVTFIHVQAFGDWKSDFNPGITYADPLFDYREERIGWPLRSMWRRIEQSSPDWLDHVTWRYPAGHRCKGLDIPSMLRPDRSRFTPRFPIMILPMGFTANTVFYSGLIGLPLAVPAMRRYRRALRVQRGLCGACGYPIGVSACCTECGATLPVTGERRAVS